MSTSDISNRRRYAKGAALSCAVTAFLVLFGYVYDLNGLGVHSGYMTYAFAITLVMCALPYSLLALMSDPPYCRAGFNLYNSGVATLVEHSLFCGVVRIAGIKSGSRFELPLLIAGGALSLCGAALFAASAIRRKGAPERRKC